jgi:hypothetical protein
VALAAMINACDQVSLKFDQNLLFFPDSRPGKNSRWHKQVRTSLELRVNDVQANTTLEITGHELIYLTRGDSAQIPAVLRDRGVKPDSAAWWFDGLEEETLAGGASHAGASAAATNPSRTLTFADILRYYFPVIAPRTRRSRLTRPACRVA